MKKITIAIDGFSSCGKSTMAKKLAKSIGYIYIDSGAMYRAVTFYCLENNLFNGKEVLIEQLRTKMNDIHITFILNKQGKPETYLNGQNIEQQIRSMNVSAHVSLVSTIDFVRTTMVAAQQQMGISKGIVMDGRDIGTTVFPEAELKIYVIASAEIRAQRRFDELQQKGEVVNFQEILENVKERDSIDQNRAISPLRKADDAFLLDNSLFTIQEQQEWLIQKYQDTIHD